MAGPISNVATGIIHLNIDGKNIDYKYTYAPRSKKNARQAVNENNLDKLADRIAHAYKDKFNTRPDKITAYISFKKPEENKPDQLQINLILKSGNKKLPHENQTVEVEESVMTPKGPEIVKKQESIQNLFQEFISAYYSPIQGAISKIEIEEEKEKGPSPLPELPEPIPVLKSKPKPIAENNHFTDKTREQLEKFLIKE